MQINSPTFLIQRLCNLHPSFLPSLYQPPSPSSPILLLFFCNNMGSQNQPTTIDGVHVKPSNTPPPSWVRPYRVLLRFLALALTLVAAFIVGLDKETKTISFSAGIHFQVTAHWKYMSAFVYFLVSNAIACCYGAASLVITEVAARRSDNGNNLRLRLVVTMWDLVIMALLFSANGAAAAVGLIGQKGNEHVQWMKVCINEFSAYCRHMTTAIVLSLVGSTAFLCLVALSLFRLN
ncbi:CASP-like protein 1E2 [Prosopis cineraria]|uniref:CASP-like protein 1E2 n=1 Tax=Prosopis cineraria TaxID=364024 RepID=UPI00240EE296|nr:CASP-like protein 1E2 [Prosopis cineraria]